MLRLAIATAAFLATTTAAVAGTVPVVPAPEVGAGVAAMTFLGLGVAWLRKRKNR